MYTVLKKEWTLQFLFLFFKHLMKVGLIEMNNFVAALVLQNYSGFFVYASVSGGRPRDTVCSRRLWQSRRQKLVPFELAQAPIHQPTASKLDRHTSTHSSLDLFHHLSWNCNLMTPDFEVGIWFSDFSTFHQSWHQPWPVSELLTFILDRELLGILANW